MRRFPVTQKPNRKESGGEKRRKKKESSALRRGSWLLRAVLLHNDNNKQAGKQTNKIYVVFGYYKNLKQNVNEDLKRTMMTT